MSYKEDYFTDFITNRSISFIKRTISTRPESPFLAVISHAAPHGPETPAPQYSTAFPNAQAPRYYLRLRRDANFRPPWANLRLGFFIIIFSGKGEKKKNASFSPRLPNKKGKKDRLIGGYPGRANIS